MLMPVSNLSPFLFPFREEEEVIEGAEVILNSLKKVAWYPSYHLSNPYPYPWTYLCPFAISENPYEVVVGVESAYE
jgi:hypothetical protein